MDIKTNAHTFTYIQMHKCAQTHALKHIYKGAYMSTHTCSDTHALSLSFTHTHRAKMKLLNAHACLLSHSKQDCPKANLHFKTTFRKKPFPTFTGNQKTLALSCAQGARPSGCAQGSLL